MPLHVTLRMAKHVWNLRSRRSFRVIEQALRVGADRFGVQVVRFSVQGNHIHLLVEAASTADLSRAIKGLSVRIAKGLNRMMDRSGRVLGDRYHARVLRTPSEVRRGMEYVADNHRRHSEAWGERLPKGFCDPYSSESPQLGVRLPEPATWLLREGWKRGSAGSHSTDSSPGPGS
jgi:REP element-mobilizing transposase RayT